MKYKAIISDLDGTLLNTHHTISEYTKKVIKEVTDKGIKFYIATGRHYLDAIAFKKMLDLDAFLISSNGAQVHNPREEELFSMTIPTNITTEIINLTMDDEIHKNLYTSDKWVSEKPLWDAQLFSNESGFNQTIIPSFDAVKNHDLLKFFFICDNEEKLVILKEELSKKFPDQLNVALSLSTCLEVMNLGVSKGMAIEKMLELEGIELSETIAFGDGMNDLEMLSIVGEGFLMGNHNPALKAALPHCEVILRNDEDGVAKKLEELFLK